MIRRAALLAVVAALSPFLYRTVDGFLSGLDEHGERGRVKGAIVEDLVDGDTIDVRIGGKSETVRLIGIDTPETVRPGVGVECGGPEASASMHDLLSVGGRVKLTSDPSQDGRDRYGRLLRYVEVDGRDVAREQLQLGWAEVYVFDSNPYQRLGGFRKASQAAKDAGRGAWGSCGGDFHSGS